MATPINDKLDEVASNGVKKVLSDGEMVELQDLDALTRAADRESKQTGQTKRRFGIPVSRVRMNGSYSD